MKLRHMSVKNDALTQLISTQKAIEHEAIEYETIEYITIPKDTGDLYKTGDRA